MSSFNLRNSCKSLVALVVAGFLLATPTKAHAAFVMTIAESGGSTVTITDNGSGDLDPTSGNIIFSGNTTSFNIQISVGTSNAPGTPTKAQLTINNTSISSLGFDGTKTLTISLLDTGFTAPTGPLLNLASQLSTTQLPTGTSVTYLSSVTNAAGTVLTNGTQLSLNTVGGAKVDNIVTAPANFGLLSVTTYTVLGQGTGNSITVQTTGNTTLSVPVPAGVVLALSGLPMLGAGYWLRRRNKA